MTEDDDVRVGSAVLAAVVVTLLVPGAVAAQRPDSAEGPALLLSTLTEGRRTMLLAEGRLSGPGADLLLREGRNAQFFLLGEEHGVAEVPALASALFRALVESGYRYLAIETGDGMAAALDSLARRTQPVDALADYYHRHWPGAPFYTLREEAALLVDAVAASPASPVLWGLDYDIMADRHALPRLRQLARTPVQRSAAERAIAVADSLLRLAMEERNPGHVMMFSGPEGVIGDLRQAFTPEPGSEVDRIVTQLEETRRINAFWVAGDGLQSNDVRARWNKRQFARYWREAVERDGEPARVMLKFGASHMMRGRTLTDVYDLGSHASELADGLGSRSFHVLVVAGAGTSSAVMDPTVMEYRPQPSGFQAQEWASAFFEVADSTAWTVFDLRPLRPLASRRHLGTLPVRLEKVIWGFDAVVVLTGSSPSTMIPFERPW